MDFTVPEEIESLRRIFTILEGTSEMQRLTVTRRLRKERWAVS